MAFNYEFPYTDPNLYNDDWLLKKMKELAASIQEILDESSKFWDAYKEFEAMIAAIESGNFPQSIQNAFREWMKKNAIDLVGELVKLVIFGITDDGYWVAYIPEGWDDIIFNTTGLDINIPGYEYGHLVLSYAVGGN